MITLEEYFWPKVDRSSDGCWNWKRGKTAAGYGTFSYDKIVRYAHRTAWELANKQKIPKKMLCCHMCDNPACCNPAHLFIGTSKMNVHDAVFKGRFHNGERRYGAKLTEAKVIEILRLKREDGLGICRIRRMFNMSHGVIQRILNGKVWTHVQRSSGANPNPPH